MERFRGLEHVVRANEPLAPFTWFRLGGPAEFFAEPTSIEELSQLVERCRSDDMPIRLLGGGSNILIRDDGVPGLTIHLAAAAFGEVQVRDNRLVAGGGAKLGHIISRAVGEGLGGLEQLAGIPGTIGGALHGNCGTQNVDIGHWTRGATVMTRNGEILERERSDLRFAYRSSSLDELVILNVEFELTPDDPKEITKRLQTQWIIKQSKQPTGSVCTGRIFKSSGGLSAASLLEQAGAKGMRIGDAEVSDQHTNFIIAHPGATSHDVQRLIDLMASRVQEQLGVELELELEIW